MTLLRLTTLAERDLQEADHAHQGAVAAHQAAQALHHHLLSHHQQLQAEMENHGNLLAHLQTDTSAADDTLEELADTFHGTLSQLGGVLDAQEHLLGQAADHAYEEVESQIQAVLDASHLLDERLQQSLQHIDTLRQVADTLLTEVQEAGGQVHGSLENLDHHLDGLLGLLNDTVTQATSLLDQRLGMVEQLLGQVQLDVLDSGQRAFLEEGLRRLEGATGGLGHALEALGISAHEGRGHVEGGAGNLLHHMQGVVQAIETIRPVLDMIQSVLS